MFKSKTGIQALAVAILLAAAPVQAATFDFSYQLQGSSLSVSGTGSFSTSTNLDGIYSVGSGIDSLTFSRPTITGGPFGELLADQASALLSRGFLSATLSGGALSDVRYLGAGSGTSGSGILIADYQLSFAINGLGANNASAHAEYHLGVIDLRDDLMGTASFNNVTPQNNGFLIQDQQSISSIFRVGEHGPVDGLSLSMFDLEHSFAGDLTFSLSHLGTTVVFADPWGDRASPTGTGTDLDGDYVLEDAVNPTFFDALNGISVLPSGAYGTSGNPFSLFNGMDRAGDWRLAITDNTLKDEGSLGRWSLRFGGANASAVPEAATWAMMIVGFGFVGAAMRRRRLQHCSAS